MRDVSTVNNMLSLDAIHLGDAVRLLNDGPEGWADLIFADPPFNIGYEYDRYNDDQSDGEYLEWTHEWIRACVRALKRTGSMYIAVGDEYAYDVDEVARGYSLHERSHIVWTYSFGQNSRTNFCRSHVNIFYFVADRERFTFNDRPIRFPSARHTIYRDKRGHPLGRLPDDTWNEYPRVCGTFKERAGWHGCQMPEALLRRVIQASSNPGDIVLDPFAGSGTTPAVAAKLGRRFVGIDISPQYVKRANERVQEALALRSAPADASGWKPLAIESLLDLYRETRLPVDQLAGNPAALGCFLNCLAERTGSTHTQEGVLAKLREVASAIPMRRDGSEDQS